MQPVQWASFEEDNPQIKNEPVHPYNLNELLLVFFDLIEFRTHKTVNVFWNKRLWVLFFSLSVSLSLSHSRNVSGKRFRLYAHAQFMTWSVFRNENSQ